MDEGLLEIRLYSGQGYQPLIDYGAWRVAILRWDEWSLPEKIDSMERHTQTDEVFVLLEGQATLILGGKGENVERVTPQWMEVGKIYNVKQNAWHSILLSRDATVLIVENRNTGVDNTDYCQLRPEIKNELITLCKAGS
jgi:ureidoglycolate hydrolase